MTIYFLLIAFGTGFGWWRDVLGGTILTFVGLAFALSVLVEMESRDYWIIIVFGLPFLLSGLLFLASWRRTRQRVERAEGPVI
jgi:hypothetical protein